MYKTTHFKLQELVSKQVFDKYGEKAWEFFDEKLLITLDWIWDTLVKENNQPPVIEINNWMFDGNAQQKGFRSNLEPMVAKYTGQNTLYCSQHMMGRAVDMDIKHMLASEFRIWALQHINEFPYPVWIEDDVNWVHIDTRQSDKPRVYLFKA